ncbi:hypothetical protein, partial [Streptomyces sp. ADI96-02]|uniref:hypothetical protein n=1 Tax=Streptomyces sp. ADI96-02 TaxID=1522760 RepID=UPI0013DE5403
MEIFHWEAIVQIHPETAMQARTLLLSAAETGDQEALSAAEAIDSRMVDGAAWRADADASLLRGFFGRTLAEAEAGSFESAVATAHQEDVRGLVEWVAYLGQQPEKSSVVE